MVVMSFENHLKFPAIKKTSDLFSGAFTAVCFCFPIKLQANDVPEDG
jgi:hypothetical protein